MPEFKPRPVSAPGKKLPDGAWDCHAHTFGPFDRFPLIPERRYEPPLAPAADYYAMLDRVGFARGVTVHASAKGWGNEGTAAAAQGSNGRVLAIGVVRPETGDAELRTMHGQGFRGLRFTETGAPAGANSPGTLYLRDLAGFAPRLKALGWHAQIWAKNDIIIGAARELVAHRIPMIFDHMGFFDVAQGVKGANFQAFLKLIPEGDFYVKMSTCRVSRLWPDYPDVRPFFDALVEAVPDRLVFGSDWPYISLDDDPPDVGHMVDLFDSWSNDATLRRKLYVDNPRAFYLR